MRVVIAVDPGSDKCGLALVSWEGEVLRKEVVSAGELVSEVLNLSRFPGHEVMAVITGDRTGSRDFAQELRKRAPNLADILVKVDEHKTSEEARRRYLREMPRSGWRKFVPLSFQVPPEPYDDYVAVLLAERYLRGRKETSC